MAPSLKWHPPDFKHRDRGRLGQICRLFVQIYPQAAYGSLAEEISDYWIDALARTWKEKAEHIRSRDRAFDPSDPQRMLKELTQARERAVPGAPVVVQTMAPVDGSEWR